MKEETLPALVYVAAGDGIRCKETPQFINFNYFNAAGIVVERFRFLRGKEGGNLLFRHLNNLLQLFFHL